MPAEKFANRPASEVAVAYTATDLTLEVDDASAFPATGVFRVVLGNTEGTIFRVDSVAGNVFTGAAEAFDGNAAIGISVKIVASRGAAERFVQSPDAGDWMGRSGSAGADDVWPNAGVKRVDQSAWAWVNQAAATAVQDKGLLHVLSPASVAGTNYRMRVKAAPTPPYTVEIGVIPLFANAGPVSNLTTVGIVLRESSTGKAVVVVVSNFRASTANAPPAFWAATLNSPTSFGAIQGSEVLPVGSGNAGLTPMLGKVWLRATDDNTNLILEFSYDRITWQTLATIGRTAHMAGGPDEVGIAWTNQSAGAAAGGWVFSWIES